MIHKRKVTILTLEEEEARWLKTIMQNPFWVEDPADEDERDREMRRRIWDALKHVETL